MKISMPNNQLQNASDLEKAFHKWNPPIYRYIYARLQRRELAEEITQEVFIKAWRFRHIFDPNRSSLKNWLFAIAINTLRDHFRKNKIPVSEIHENIPGVDDLATEISNKNLVQFVFQRVQEMDEREQTLLILRYQEDMDIQEIADILKMKYSATKVAIHRAIKKLQILCDEGD